MSDYLEQLRENVLDSYVCFFHAVTESESPNLILNSIPTIMQYLAVTCTKEFNPTVVRIFSLMRRILILLKRII